MNWRVLSVIIVSVGLLLPQVACIAADDEEPEPKPLAVGVEAPDFKLKDLKGKQVHLKSVLETKVVLLAFFATWHPKSKAQIVRLKPVAEEFKDRPLRVLAVALDRGGKDVVGPLAEQQEINFPILIDSELTSKDKYQIKATLPLVFVIGQDGKIKRMEKALDEEALARLRNTAKAELERARSREGSERPG